VNLVHNTLNTRYIQRAIKSETLAVLVCGRNKQKIKEQKTTNKSEDGGEKFEKKDK